MTGNPDSSLIVVKLIPSPAGAEIELYHVRLIAYDIKQGIQI